MKNKCVAVFLCLALLSYHSAYTYAQVPGGGNSRECAGFDHCVDKVESRYRSAMSSCTYLDVAGIITCAVIGSVSVVVIGGIVLGIGCAVYIDMEVKNCKNRAKNNYRRNVGPCQAFNTSGRCYRSVPWL